MEDESLGSCLALKPLVSRLRYASQVIQIRSQNRCPGHYRPFKVIQSNTITLAHSDEPYMRKYGKLMKTRFHELEHESEMRLLNPTPLNGETTKLTRKAKKKEKEGGLSVRDRKNGTPRKKGKEGCLSVRGRKNGTPRKKGKEGGLSVRDRKNGTPRKKGKEGGLSVRDRKNVKENRRQTICKGGQGENVSTKRREPK